MSSGAKKIDPKTLSHWKPLDRFRQVLAEVQARRGPRSDSSADPKRKLLEEDYFCLLLFGLLNPVLDSMRGLCAASRVEKIQEEVCSRPVSLGSFSEAQSVFDPDLLKEVFAELARQMPVGSSSKAGSRLAGLGSGLKLVDGTLLPALPRMQWALWLNKENRAAKLHLKFSVLRDGPCEALVTAGNACERKALRAMVKKGETLVGDRYYGLHYAFLRELKSVGASFIFRVRNHPRMEKVEELTTSEADRAAGVAWQALVKLGEDWEGEPVRVVKIEAEGKELLLATDLEAEAELISLAYRHRWQIELFFKWMKCILGNRHLLAESPSGVAIQVYCALIAALLLQSLTGKKPRKREMEAIRFHLLGYIGDKELEGLLGLAKTEK